MWNHIRPQIATANLKERKSVGEITLPDIKLFQSQNNQNIMVQGSKQTYRIMVRNREPRNKPTPLWSINI